MTAPKHRRKPEPMEAGPHGDGGPPPLSPAEDPPSPKHFGGTSGRLQALDRVGSRREFFRAIPRLLLLGGLAALSAALSSRKGRPTHPNDVCSNKGVCNGCAAFKGCGLPLALSVRARSAGEVDHG